MAFGARSFNGSSEYVTLSGLPTLTSTISISAWYNLAGSPGGFPNRYGIINKTDATANFISYYLMLTNVGIDFIYTTGGATFVDFITTTSFDTGVWHSVVISSDFTTAGTKIYLDGVSQSFATAGTPAAVAVGTPTTFLIGKFLAAGADFFNGSLADIGLWSVQLSAGEAFGISRGRRPQDVRQQSLVGYWPLGGIQSPEPDLSGQIQNGTLTGTTNAAGPPIAMYTPRRPMFIPGAAAATFIPAWARSSNLPVLGTGNY